MESLYDHGHASAGNAAFTARMVAAGAAQNNSTASIGANIQSLASLLNRNLREALQQEDIGAAQWKVLKEIERTDPVTVGALSNALGVSPATILKLADELMTLGFVGADSCGRFEVSPVGLAVVRRVERTVEMKQNWLTLAVDEHDLTIFQQVCDSLSKALAGNDGALAQDACA